MQLQQRPLVGALELGWSFRVLRSWDQRVMPLLDAHQPNARCRLPPEWRPNLGRSSSFIPRTTEKDVAVATGEWVFRSWRGNPGNMALHPLHTCTVIQSAGCSVTHVKLLNTQSNQWLALSRSIHRGRGALKNQVLWFSPAYWNVIDI